MSDIPLSQRQDLELRYDGPIPRQHLRGAGAHRRRQRGAMALLESQAAQFLDAAERCQAEMEDMADEAGAIELQKAQAEVTRCDAHIRAAAEAFCQAIPLRQALGLAPHPIVMLLGILPLLQTLRINKEKQ